MMILPASSAAFLAALILASSSAFFAWTAKSSRRFFAIVPEILKVHNLTSVARVAVFYFNSFYTN